MIFDDVRNGIGSEDRTDVKTDNRAERQDSDFDDTQSHDAHVDEVSPRALHEVGARRVCDVEDGCDLHGFFGHGVQWGGVVF